MLGETGKAPSFFKQGHGQGNRSNKLLGNNVGTIPRPGNGEPGRVCFGSCIFPCGAHPAPNTHSHTARRSTQPLHVRPQRYFRYQAARKVRSRKEVASMKEE